MENERPILFNEVPSLRRKIPWIELGEFPTPVEKLSSLGKNEGLSEFYIKRDDLSSPFYGGNKVRKLEFLLANALEKHKRCAITFGGAGSNHFLATVIHAERVGIQTIGVLFPQPNAYYVRKNLLLDRTHGATLIPSATLITVPLAFVEALFRGFLIEGGRMPFIIPPGGTNIAGCLGYVEAAFELKRQIEDGLLPEPEFIFVTLGSAGTAAGLLAGAILSGLRSKIVAVRVVERIVCNEMILGWHTNRTLQFLSRLSPQLQSRKVKKSEILVLNDYAGEKYAKFTAKGVEAVRKARELEGLSLDGTYTGKTLAAALDFLKNGRNKSPALFINTYNSVDLSGEIKNVDYHGLPKPLHRYFEEPTQEEQMGLDYL
ncbi:MAG: pyridoxal-phosphate dependent enzyme [Actinomycetota bacterium]|nr:pyridoxal-phosphate dependent enzyme [Actinomycetota bacterium]